jgi:Ca2+-binding RTX toxin-like protein
MPLTSTGPTDPVFVSSNSTLLDASLISGGVDAQFIIHGQLFNDSSALMDVYTATPGDVPVLYVGETGSLSNIVQVYQGNSLSLINYGNIYTNSPFGTTIAVYEDLSQNFFSLQNAGTISATSTGQSGAPVRFAATIASDIGGVVTNSGTIYSPVRAIFLGDKSGISHGDLTNTGIIDGDVLFEGGNDLFDNYGQVFGDVDLGAGNDYLDGTAGKVFGDIDGGKGNDTIIGGDNNDNIDGGTEFDLLRGNGGEDNLVAGSGNDTAYGGDGNDNIEGSTGSDLMGGGAGNDEMTGGGGNDTMTGYTGDDTISGNDGSDQMMGGTGNDTLNGGKGHDTMYGGDGNDSLGGGENNDIMAGGEGDDLMLGWTGNDIMAGNQGQDDMRGQAGSDHLNGGWGNDTLNGGSENDFFEFVRHSGDDVIEDFEDGIDLIDLTAFQLADFAALSGAISDYNGGSLIDLDALGGDGSVWVQWVSAVSLTTADFIL